MMHTKTKAVAAGGGVTAGMALAWAINYFGKFHMDANDLLMLSGGLGIALASFGTWLAPYRPE